MNIGKMRIEQTVLLDLLDFSGGRIVNVNLDEWSNVELTIIHPDMPEVSQQDPIIFVTPVYRKINDKNIRIKES